MVNKNIQMKNRSGSGWDNLFPLTLSENVFDNNGVKLSTSLSNLENFVDGEVATLNQSLLALEQDTSNKLTQVEQRTDSKLKYTFKSGDMTLFNLQKRHQANSQSFVSVQGSCFLGGSGKNIQYALGLLSTDGNPNDVGAIVTTNGSSMINETSGNSLPIYHANGMDYNPETETIFVSHANKYGVNGNTPDNRLSEISKDGKTFIKHINPKGIPSGRRVKYYTYDKITGKKYIGDDLGIYEVDNNFNVLKVINFSKKFIEYKSWGLGQTAVVHNDIIFYLTLGPSTLVVFNIKGELLYLDEIPKFTNSGVFVGAEPQSLFFDNEDNLYMATRTNGLDYRLENFYTRIFKMSPFTSISTNDFIGTHNTNTENYVYVTANPTSPISNGSKEYPFHSLDEAVIYVNTSKYQIGFQVSIFLESGNYGRSDIRTNGLKINITGLTNDVYFDALRFFNTDVVLKKIQINKAHHNYSLSGNNSKIILDGVKIYGNNKEYGILLDYGSFLSGRNGQGNIISNCQKGVYANSSVIIGNIYSLGLGSHSNPVELSSSGFAPLIQ